MYGVIETGGKQFKVEKGSILRAEKIEGEIGDTVSFDNIMLFDDSKLSLASGDKNLAKIEAKILSHGKLDKILVFKKRRRKNSRRMNGHRQSYTEVEITKIAN